MLTLGVDLSSQDVNTAICVLRWDGSRCEIRDLKTNVGNEEILALMGHAHVTGIDAPFGWPARFVAALSDWTSTDRWVEPWNRPTQGKLRLRETDRWIHDQIKKWPMSVSADSIAMCAMRAAALLGATRLPIDRVNGPHFEVYPGAALIRWDLAKIARGYKTDADTRVALVAEIERRCPWLALVASDRVELARTDHAVDALLSSLVARAAAEKKTVRPPDGLDSDVLAREGWIHLPVADSLATLAE